MKKNILFLAAVFLFLFNSCSTSKNAGTDKALYETTWQLEYISGPRIAFEGLFPEKKPEITFIKADNTVNGNSSCNGFSTSFELNGKTIKIETPKAMTMRYCEGGGEQVFLKTMEKINAYSFDKDNKLNLMIDEVPMMRFKKVNP
jgi:heat shock protein HslJ